MRKNLTTPDKISLYPFTSGTKLAKAKERGICLFFPVVMRGNLHLSDSLVPTSVEAFHFEPERDKSSFVINAFNQSS